MVLHSPADALGSHAPGVRELLIEVVRSRHDRATEAHLASGSRYSMGFGSQWRDLLDDAREALADRGFQSHKLAPAGHELPVVNDCLLYVWRVPRTPDALSNFASSPTRKNGFAAQPPDPMLFEPGFEEASEPDNEVAEATDVATAERLVVAVGGTMPLVLVMVHSSPRQLQSIEWAVAVLDDEGKVKLHGHETIWQPEVVFERVTADVEAFDSGTPVAPVVELQKQEGTHPDA
ncbi:hypothetical protein IU470_14610 [Nocardia abscessus]|uniref:Uncharacterized protein n=1 Tax=Nocardia abscessus TaxID=120957 RepID=A0ABS0C7H7_9NOCA|nr:hypothetical protein [Nocardia abscessus]MBF6226329.1 hypothetical protein [Nocardia abscessus]